MVSLSSFGLFCIFVKLMYTRRGFAGVFDDNFNVIINIYYDTLRKLIYCIEFNCDFMDYTLLLILNIF